MIKVFIYSCLLLVFLINCKSNIPEARNKTDYSQITHYSSRSAHPISSVNFDTIRIDAGNENEMTSLLGSFLFLGDTLCFADREQSTLFLYDRDGRFLGTHLSYGRGPQEIQGIYEITALPQGGYAIINDWHLNIFDQSWGGKQQLRIDWQNDKTPKSCSLLQVLTKVEFTKLNTLPVDYAHWETIWPSLSLPTVLLTTVSVRTARQLIFMKTVIPWDSSIPVPAK